MVCVHIVQWFLNDQLKLCMPIGITLRPIGLTILHSVVGQSPLQSISYCTISCVTVNVDSIFCSETFMPRKNHFSHALHKRGSTNLVFAGGHLPCFKHILSIFFHLFS